jgi:methyl-accepting chemotaxis protein
MASNTLERATATGTTIERIARAVEEIKQYNSQIATASEQQMSMAIYFDPPLANKIDPPFIV